MKWRIARLCVPFLDQLTELLGKVALQRLGAKAVLEVLKVCCPGLAFGKELCFLRAGLGVVDFLVELLLVGLLCDKVAVLQAVGVSTEDVDPLVVFSGANGIRLGQGACKWLVIKVCLLDTYIFQVGMGILSRSLSGTYQ